MGGLTPETLIDRVLGYRRSIAVGAEMPDDAFGTALIGYEESPLAKGAMERLLETFNAYRLDVQARLSGAA